MNGYFNNEQKLADDYETPGWFFDILNKRFNFSVDLACDSKNCKVSDSPLHDKGFNAIEEEWSQWKGMKYIFPPFSKPYFNQYLNKAHREYEKGESSVMIVPLKTISVDYFQHIMPPVISIVYPRLKFLYNGRENHTGEATCILFYDCNVQKRIKPDIDYLDISRFAPSTYRKV